MEIINEAEKAAEKDIWSLMQFTQNLRRQHGKEPYSMETLLKKLALREKNGGRSRDYKDICFRKDGWHENKHE